MNTNEKGQIGLIETIRELTHEGFECFAPLHDYSPVDLIVLNKKFKPIRLQVKYRKLSNGAIQVPFRTSVNGKDVPIDLDVIDGWAVYCPEANDNTGIVVFVGKHEIDLSLLRFAFRLTECKTARNMTKNEKCLQNSVD